MPFRVLCPTCSVKIKSPRKWAGKQFTCPKCQKPMRLPELADADVYPFVTVAANAPPEAREAQEALEPIILDEPEVVPPPPPPAVAPVRAQPVAAPPVIPPVEISFDEAAPVVPPPPVVEAKDVYDELATKVQAREVRTPAKSRRVLVGLALVLLGLAVILPLVGVFGWSFLSTESKQFVRDVTRLGGPWKLYEPPDGSFVAVFPKLPLNVYSVFPADPPFVDTKPETLAALKKPKRMGMFSSEGPGGTYFVSYQSVAGNRNDPETLDALAVARPMWIQTKDGEEMIRTEPTTVAGYPGRRVLVRKGRSVVDARYTIVKDRTFLVAVLMQNDGEEPNPEEAFFHYFKIKDFTPYPHPLSTTLPLGPTPAPNAKAAGPPGSKPQ